VSVHAPFFAGVCVATAAFSSGIDTVYVMEVMRGQCGCCFLRIAQAWGGASEK
jgi:hypothetical protein